MRIILLGPIGSGKGTQARLLASRLLIPHVSTGDLFRGLAGLDTPLARRVKAVMAQGILVDDATVTEVLKERLARPDCRAGFVLDGYPRNLAQASLLEQITPVDRVILLDVPEQEIVRRLAARRTCRGCGAIYGMDRPSHEGICDDCGGALVQREDDKAAVVKKRIEVYRKETLPLIDFYERQHLLRVVNGAQKVGAVQQEILAAARQ